MTVTYGDRWDVLSQVLRAVDDPQFVERIIVVDNDSDYVVADRVRDLACSVPCEVLCAGSNLGSAGGYSLGLAALSEADPGTWALLLDDDNAVRPGALNVLSDRLPSATSAQAFLMNRYSRREIREAIHQRRPVVNRLDTFAGLSVRHTLFNLGDPLNDQEEITAEYAPYGGFCFNTALISTLGLPMVSYYLYSDDHEYTTRLHVAGVRITLLENASLHDLEYTWHQRHRLTLLACMDLAADDDRIYYSLRNRRHFERMYLEKLSIERHLNAVAFTTAVAVDSVRLWIQRQPRQKILRRLVTVRRALSDGKIGRLGRRSVLDTTG